jgi:hypothetical protein
MKLKHQICPCNRPWRSVGFRGFQFSRQSAQRWQRRQPYASSALNPQKDFVLLMSIIGRVKRWVRLWLEGNWKMLLNNRVQTRDLSAWSIVPIYIIYICVFIIYIYILLVGQTVIVSSCGYACCWQMGTDKTLRHSMYLYQDLPHASSRHGPYATCTRLTCKGGERIPKALKWGPAS